MSTKNFKNTEILYVIDAIAREKAINADELFSALEEVIATTAKIQYGDAGNITVHMDKKTGNIEIISSLKVVSDNDYEESDDRTGIIALSLAKKIQKDIKLDDLLQEELPPLDMSRMSAHAAKGLIITKLKELEIDKQYNQLQDRVGEIVQGMIRSIDKRGATLIIEGIETYIPRSQMIKGDNYKVGDRMKVYLVKIEKTAYEVAMTLSRIHTEFLAKLLYNEVPELQDGLIEIKNIVRDAGSRAKLAVYAPDKSIDAIGACIGVKGSRIQPVIAELAGERIDVIRWAADISQYIVNCFLPIQILKIIVDEDQNAVDIEVMDKDLSAVIGRQGQNIRLISKLSGLHINVNSDRLQNNVQTNDNALQNLMNALDIDDLLAHLLISEGCKTVHDIIKLGEGKISNIDGLDEAIAGELVLRAQEFIAQNEDVETISTQLPMPQQNRNNKKKPEDDLITITNEIRNALHHAGITSLQAIAEMSSDELQDILIESNVNIPKHKIDEVVMNLREKLFFNVSN